LLTDPHSPSIERVSIVRNMDPFYKAYDPKPGSKLYLAPVDRIRVW
jgi:putative endopeptidase